MGGKLIVVGGLPGSGKTKVGKELCRRIDGAIFLDKDTLSRSFVEEMLVLLESTKDDRESKDYLERVRPLEYDVMMKQAFENVELGKVAILSAPFIKELYTPEWVENLKVDVELSDAELHLVWVSCSINTMKNRLIDRKASRDSWKINHWYEYIESLPASPPSIDELHIFMNDPAAGSGIDESISGLINKISS